jgi:cytidine deaminase
MKKSDYTFTFDVYDSIGELAKQDAILLDKARVATGNAYAPYSHFRVGAAAELANGEIVTGCNQENVSFPAGICAERVLLSAVSSLFPAIPIISMAVSYHNENGKSDTPVSPCGICRQSLQQYEQRFEKPIRLILSGSEGEVYVIPQAGLLLPLAFQFEA